MISSDGDVTQMRTPARGLPTEPVSTHAIAAIDAVLVGIEAGKEDAKAELRKFIDKVEGEWFRNAEDVGAGRYPLRLWNMLRDHAGLTRHSEDTLTQREREIYEESHHPCAERKAAVPPVSATEWTIARLNREAIIGPPEEDIQDLF